MHVPAAVFVSLLVGGVAGFRSPHRYPPAFQTFPCRYVSRTLPSSPALRRLPRSVLSALPLPGSDGKTAHTPPVAAAIASANSASPLATWRLTLSVGDGTPGARILPLKVTVEVTPPNLLRPLDPTVFFTDFIEGSSVTAAKEFPVRPGSWKLEGTELLLDLEFPEAMARGDVEFPAGRIYFKGELYSSERLAELDGEYAAARKIANTAEKAVRAFEDQKDRPKVWNDAAKEWERPSMEGGTGSLPLKKIERARANAEVERMAAGRIQRESLSFCEGAWPGIDDSVYIRKKGKLTTGSARRGFFGSIFGEGGRAVGSWQAEPVIAGQEGMYY